MANNDIVRDIIDKPSLLEESRQRLSSLAKVAYLPDEISYLKFFNDYLVPNLPCVFGPWLTADWKCRKEWVTAGPRDDVDFTKLKRLFGDVTVPVANCKSRQYDAQIKTDWKFSDYLDYLEGFQIEV